MLKIYPLSFVVFVFAWNVIVPSKAHCQSLEVFAHRADTAPVIDGVLDDAVWETARPVTDFVQRRPDEGAQPTQRTEVRILYDDAAIYIGARMFDSSPDSIVARVGRRDTSLDSDLFGVFIDSYFDRRSGYYFGVNAGGTLLDGILFNDDWDDDSWDGVWEGRARVDDEGWTAEIRIPFSQLRFREREEQIWGINFRRDIARHNEQIFLVYTPRNESGFVSRFAALRGINGIDPPRRIELLPYVTTRAVFADHTAGDPFRNGREYRPAAGLDFKLGLGSNLTLDATVNPDFGQVEVDPAVVNLSDVETFFQERRPFFVEGASTFSFGQGGARNYWNFNWSSPRLFYSRRIGRSPRGSLPDHDFALTPDGTRILGAAKLTGRVAGGTSIGMISALTNREVARLQHGPDRLRAEIEPLAYSGVYRIQRDIRDGFRGIGVLSTINARSFSDDRMRREVSSSASVTGVDGWTFLDSERTWVLTGWVAGSHVRGREDYMTRLQRSSVHYFQRPDAGHLHVDSSATSLSGLAARFHLNKQRGRSFLNTAVGIISPGFNVNDLGFMSRGDVINAHFGAGYQWSEPRGIRRYSELGGAVFSNHDFEGNLTWAGAFHFGYFEFANYYRLNWNLAYNPQTINNRRTRGGPLTINPPGYQVNGSIRSDNRKPWVFAVGAFTYQTSHGGEVQSELSIAWQPAPNFSLSLSPGVSRLIENAQWVGAFDDDTATATHGRRYVFARMDQRSVSASVRMNWTFTPRLSLQLYAQPLLSAGRYSDFKELRRARSYDFLIYGKDGSHFDGENFTAYPDGIGGSELRFDDPNFNVLSLRGNAVLRWEFRRGSTFYLVWTQRRSDYLELGDMYLDRTIPRLLDASAENIFLLKLNYWLNI
jgi:hypothetical protein